MQGRRFVTLGVRLALFVGGGLCVLALGGVWIYLNVLHDPPPPRLVVVVENGDVLRSAPIDLDGSWTVSATSIAGYRVEKWLAGQRTEAVGRTHDITGSVDISDRTVVAGSFTVDLGTMRSDSAQRDAAFRGRIMDVAKWPTAEFVLGERIYLEDAARRGAVLEGTLMGTLRMRGRAMEVAFETEAALLGDGRISLVARYVAPFAAWGITNPSQPGVIVREEALLEVQLVLDRAGA